MVNFFDIIKNASTWNDIYEEILKQKEPGKLFEKFCKYYFLVEPSVRDNYKNVWLFSEIPNDIKDKLEFGKSDYGVDILLQDHENRFSVVQCKFKEDQSLGISWSRDKIGNFYAEGNEGDYFIIFTNASKLDRHSLSKKKNRLKFLSLGNLLNISSSTINEMRIYIESKKKLKREIKKPREYQISAIESVVNKFKNEDRGQLILPCGAGKTLVALWVKESLESKHTLVLVPSLALLKQIKDEWSINCKSPIPYICVCSEKDISKNENESLVYLYEILGKVTTRSEEILNFIEENESSIVYSTYQSLHSIKKALEHIDFKFDLAICDEAHKTSGSKSKNFGIIHFDKNIPVKKRLYMSATPRVLSSSLKSKLKKDTLEMYL